MRIAYIAAAVTTGITALRANLLLDQAQYQGGIPWLVAALLTGLAAMWTGKIIAGHGTQSADDVV